MPFLLWHNRMTLLAEMAGRDHAHHSWVLVHKLAHNPHHTYSQLHSTSCKGCNKTCLRPPSLPHSLRSCGDKTLEVGFTDTFKTPSRSASRIISSQHPVQQRSNSPEWCSEVLQRPDLPHQKSRRSLTRWVDVLQEQAWSQAKLPTFDS